MKPAPDEPFPKVGDKLKESLNSEQKKNADPFIAVNEDSIMSLLILHYWVVILMKVLVENSLLKKRSVVIKKQTEGYYVPPCTMMVFTKSFTSAEKINEENKENKFDFWSDIDRKEYLKSIEEILTDYFGQKPKGKEESEEITLLHKHIIHLVLLIFNIIKHHQFKNISKVNLYL